MYYKIITGAPPPPLIRVVLTFDSRCRVQCCGRGHPLPVRAAAHQSPHQGQVGHPRARALHNDNDFCFQQ